MEWYKWSVGAWQLYRNVWDYGRSSDGSFLSWVAEKHQHNYLFGPIINISKPSAWVWEGNFPGREIVSLCSVPTHLPHPKHHVTRQVTLRDGALVVTIRVWNRDFCWVERLRYTWPKPDRMVCDIALWSVPANNGPTWSWYEWYEWSGTSGVVRVECWSLAAL